MKKKLLICSVLVAGLFAVNAQALLVDLGPGSFTPAATVITFSEAGYPVGTVNPSYTLAAGTLGTVTVDFEGHFLGQAETGGFPNTLVGSPSGPLTLDPSATDTRIVIDGAAPTSPVLSGGPTTFNGPISVLFSVPVAAVGLSGGYFNALNSTTIEAFDASGSSLGSIVNSALGIEFYGLADSGGAEVIQGISFYITGPEPFGFGIDNLTFGAANVVRTPDPGSTGVLLLGSLLVLAYGRNRELRS